VSCQQTKHFEKSFISSNLEALGDDPDPDAVADIKGATAVIFSAATDAVS